MIYIVIFKDKSNEKVITSLGGEIVYPYKNLRRLLAIRADKETVEKIKNHPDVECVEPDGEFDVPESEFDVPESENEGQQESYAIEGLQVREYWDRGYKGQGVKVAVMDYGCQPHEDLRVTGGYNAYDPTQTYMADVNGHGTYVAGILAMQDNDVGYVGIAPECELYIVKLDDNEGGRLQYSAMIEGINWCIENEIDIVNFSSGGTTEHEGRKEAFREATEQGLILVTSAGNNHGRDQPITENTITYPGRHDFMVTVANIQEDNTRRWSSSCGPELTFSAYGTNIPSTDIDPDNDISKKYDDSRIGTSHASPHIAGMFALYKQIFPNLDREELIQKMIDNAKRLGSHLEYGYGLPQPPPELYADDPPPISEITLGGPDPNGHIKVYDLNFRPLAFLENAFNIGYEKNFNELWYASFSMPLDDPKNEYCQPFYYVEIYEDKDTRVDLFRIMPENIVKDESNRQINYECEHVLATLMDDVLFRYHHSGTNQTTRTVLQYILNQQTVTRWQLGDVDFERYFEYKWENENLLAALFSVPKPIGQHMWEWDTTSFPWTLHLREAPLEVTSEIRYRKNMQSIEKEEDPTDIVTRLYALGYGEGVNQLGIENVNPTGLPYIDADTQDKYGIISSVWVDKRFEDEESLFESAKQQLEHLKIPRLTYTAKAVDLARITDEPVEKFKCGYITRIYDDELGIEVYARIVKESKPDIKGDPGNIDIEIANKARDIAGSIADLNDRQRINEVYAQGATNLIPLNFADNCDPDHPAVMRFRIPEEMRRINKVLLSYRSEPFRGYSRATKGGGATTVSSSSGGGTSVTSSSGGGTQRSTASGGSSSPTSSAGGDHRHRMFVYLTDDVPTITRRSFRPQDSTHTVVFESSRGADLFTASSSGNHTHNVNIPAHTHDFEVPNHTHEVTIPNHTHEVTIPNHTHEIEHGIYEGPTPTQVTIEVDGNTVPVTDIDADEVDLVPYLAKDEGGKIQRGRWAEIKITPNNLARIVADVYVQMFVQSRGGVDA